PNQSRLEWVRRRALREGLPLGKKKTKRSKVSLGDTTPAGFNNPFAALLQDKTAPASKPEETPAATPPSKPDDEPTPDGSDLAHCRKIVLQRERKRRRGHTAVVITGLELEPTALKRLAKSLRKALGCGASVDGDAIVVQGDIADRVQTWLTEHGATTVIRGN
ncbi:MAG: translation initiation factor, partial [Myxococcota bacterium]